MDLSFKILYVHMCVCKCVHAHVFLSTQGSFIYLHSPSQVCGCMYMGAYVYMCTNAHAWAHAHSGRIWGGQKTSCESFGQQCPLNRTQSKEVPGYPKYESWPSAKNFPPITKSKPTSSHVLGILHLLQDTWILSPNLRVTHAVLKQRQCISSYTWHKRIRKQNVYVCLKGRLIDGEIPQ